MRGFSAFILAFIVGALLAGASPVPADALSIANCMPIVCTDGTEYPRCTPQGFPIQYFVDPCSLHPSSSCGNHICETGEATTCYCDDVPNAPHLCKAPCTTGTCPTDCPNPVPPAAFCGDRICQSGEVQCSQSGLTQTCSWCRRDCSTPPKPVPPAPQCGNGICEKNENIVLCPVCAAGTPPEDCRCTVVPCPSDCPLVGKKKPRTKRARVRCMQSSQGDFRTRTCTIEYR